MKTKSSPWQYLQLLHTSHATKEGDNINVHMMIHHFRHSYIILCTVTPFYAQLHHSMHSYSALCTVTPLYAQLHHFMHRYITLCTVTPLYTQLQTIPQPSHTHIYICKSYHNHNDSGCISLYLYVSSCNMVRMSEGERWECNLYTQ